MSKYDFLSRQKLHTARCVILTIAIGMGVRLYLINPASIKGVLRVLPFCTIFFKTKIKVDREKNHGTCRAPTVFYQNNMYFIRMMLLWLVLMARCSGSDEIPLDRAEQSSNYSTYFAARAIDNDIGSRTCTNQEDPAWWRVYFSSSSTVERVLVEKGDNYDASCVYTVSVYDGEVQTVCGTYTGKPKG